MASTWRAVLSTAAGCRPRSRTNVLTRSPACLLLLCSYEQAFRALEQASRHMHTKWRVWANYVIVAEQIRNYAKAVYGMSLLLELW